MFRCTPLGLSISGVEDQVPLPLGACSRKSVRSTELNDACGCYNSTFAKNKYSPMHIYLSQCLHHSQTQVPTGLDLLEFSNRPIWF